MKDSNADTHGYILAVWYNIDKVEDVEMNQSYDVAWPNYKHEGTGGKESMPHDAGINSQKSQ